MTSNETSSAPADLPGTGKLIKASLVSLAVAAVVLFVAVLPAEYGIDPTGLGSRFGLTVLHDPQASESMSEPASAAVNAPTDLGLNLLAPTGSPVTRKTGPYRSDRMTLKLAPGEGAEIKARMKAGENFLFHWRSTGPVHFDMHGERLNAGDDFTSFWLGRAQAQASGAFAAPFEGTHGWYWQNPGSAAVTVTLDISGYYAELYRP